MEFFSTIAMHDQAKYLTAQLKGKEYKITGKVLCDIYKFTTKEPRASPMGFKVDPHWVLLSPCEQFKKMVASSGLISDVVHKYLCHMIFGKQESNKVSEQQMLSRYHKENRVQANEPSIFAEWISVKELHHAQFIKTASATGSSQTTAGTSGAPVQTTPHGIGEDDADAKDRPDREASQNLPSKSRQTDAYSEQAPV
ncbi:hypothetical protein STAS_09493 [Striga asiatica]|uniref:Uncharacterized protein n=1 Tax=Striga asiatica TaxID=4170 RepID=A0A5A7PL75_STRAF|nr:hypothetical protein STAS_09493 [Striga asiatica]